jgi:hypothetical protein
MLLLLLLLLLLRLSLLGAGQCAGQGPRAVLLQRRQLTLTSAVADMLLLLLQCCCNAAGAAAAVVAAMLGAGQCAGQGPRAVLFQRQQLTLTSAVAHTLLLLLLLRLPLHCWSQGNALGKGPVLFCFSAKGLRHLSRC